MLRIKTQFSNKNTTKIDPFYGTQNQFSTSKPQQIVTITKHKFISPRGRLLLADFDNNT